MTTFERFEREIPTLMDELSPSQLPDYLDDMLRQTARTSQRPAWSSLERWLPMGVIARTQPMRLLPWRMIAIAAALLILATAALAYVGSQPSRLPAPFGPARNGAIVFANAEGDIVSVDPATGEATTIVAGSETDSDPWFSNDGTKFAFDRRTAGDAIDRSLFIANSDGSGVHQLMGPGSQIDWFDWSPDGDRIFISRTSDMLGAITIVDANDGTTATFDVEFDVGAVSWRPNSDQLVVTAPGAFYVVGADGSGLRQIIADPDAINEPTVSPDGSKLAYASWTTGAEGRIHVIDIDSGVDSGVDFAPAFVYLSPFFSPDGTKLVVHRSDADGYLLTILPVDGRGPAVPMGVHHPDMTNGARVLFSPDGTKVLATYQDDGTTWLLDTATGEGEHVSWPIPKETSGSWQRLAP
jgi:Tol biopolymer transport system component